LKIELLSRPAQVSRSRKETVEASTAVSVWQRRRDSIIASLLLVTLACGTIWTAGNYLAATLFMPREPATETLLLGIERNDAQPWLSPERLAQGLPPIGRVPENIGRAIQTAARETGVDATYLTTVAAKESSFDPLARSRGSTAAGLYQFTADTWLRVIKAFGRSHGLADYADQIAIDREGAVSMRNTAARTGLLQRRYDPQLAAVMAAELAKDNKTRLERSLGRAVTTSELYIAHFLGVPQAAVLITAAGSSPRTTGAELLPAAAGSNPEVFGSAGKAIPAHLIVARINAYFSGR
jgi:hypothetical protein